MNNWNGKVRCIKESDVGLFKEGEVYNVKNSKTEGCFSTVNNVEELNRCVYSQFEEVFDKVKLLLKHNYHLKIEDRFYHIYKYPTFNVLSVYNENCKSREYEIRWGEAFNTTLADIQPILDVLNIEIIEEQPKYKIDIEGEYSKEELEVIKKAGVKFKKVEDNNG